MLADGERRSAQLSGNRSILVMLCRSIMASCRQSLLVYQLLFLGSFYEQWHCYSVDRRLCYSVVRHCSSYFFYLPISGLPLTQRLFSATSLTSGDLIQTGWELAPTKVSMSTLWSFIIFFVKASTDSSPLSIISAIRSAWSFANGCEKWGINDNWGPP